MVIYNKLIIGGVEYADTVQILLNRDISDFNTTSSFTAEFRNDNGQYDNTFALNQDVEIYADKDVDLATTEGTYISSWDTSAHGSINFRITTDGTNIWIVDAFDKEVYRYDMDGNYVDSFDTTGYGTNNVGIATDGTNIWTVDNVADEVYKYDMSGNYIDSWDTSSETGNPVGIATDGNNIWIVDDVAKEVYKYDMVGSYINSFDTNGHGTGNRGITTDGNNIWIVDPGDKEVHKYTMVGVYVSSWDTSAHGSNNIGIATYGDYFWVLDLTDKEVYKYWNYAIPQIFLGVIESIRFRGKGQDEKVFLRGRDYGAILQDIMVSPRIFKETETSEIVTALLNQNARDTGLTYTYNVDVTSTTIDKITFSNISLFDALKELASISGYYFYVDVDKDLNFKQKEGVSSGLTFDNTNVTKSNFKRTDSDIFNYVTVYGDRQLTGAIETFGPQAGSVYTLDAKPYSVSVIGSASPNVPIQPGGILYLNDPETDNVQFLVNFQGQEIILTSGIEGGYNTGWIGSSIIIDYDRSSPLLSIRQDSASQATYGMKQKVIIDTNIKDLNEANTRAATFLSEHKNPITMGDMSIIGVVDVTPGETCVVDIPFHGINNSTYTILSASYIFNPKNNLIDNVLKLTVNRSLKTKDFIDIFKVQELRIRALEGATVESAITNVELGVGSVAIAGSYVAVRRDIGSAFYFHIPEHNLFNSDTSLLGDMRAGSSILEGSW